MWLHMCSFVRLTQCYRFISGNFFLVVQCIVMLHTSELCCVECHVLNRNVLIFNRNPMSLYLVQYNKSMQICTFDWILAYFNAYTFYSDNVAVSEYQVNGNNWRITMKTVICIWTGFQVIFCQRLSHRNLNAFYPKIIVHLEINAYNVQTCTQCISHHWEAP